MDCSLSGSSVRGDSPGKNTGVGCHFLRQCMKVKSESEVAQSCPTLSDPMDCSPPGSSIHGIFQARVLEWGSPIGQCKSTIFIHILPPSWASLPSCHPTPLGYHRAPGWAPCVIHTNFSPVTYFKHGSVYRCYFLHSSHSLLPLVCPQLHSLYLSLHSFPASKFINTIFLDSIYMH